MTQVSTPKAMLELAERERIRAEALEEAALLAEEYRNFAIAKLIRSLANGGNHG
jgi:hypothetical protein